ncbi:SpoIIE family protein phosphatase [Pseudoalteromonas sp. MMG005]|uniref:SpoIIE family protein phosphatase n=1 Tax=Pseudoalteromonas sp. MMG005 TaxID=2822682 RepID=UPI001B39D3B3|nr:SpoIIE family protein phosphatase [Pseudoalteromonas sp. MMG005]MBQ4846089.1 SpoIIE family protein phosphatase [Pseudoalteromonas sp. MMG005]
MNEPIYHRRFSLIAPAVTEIRHVLKHVLSGLAVLSDDLDAAGLVITEYLTNLLRHSKGEDETIVLLITRNKTGDYTLEVIDNLTPYDLFACNESDWDINSGILVEGGMGVELIRHYFPKAAYTSKRSKNHFSIPLTQGKNKPKAVYVDDDLAQLALINAYLKDDYDVIVCQELSEAWQAITLHDVQVLILDYQLQKQTSEPLLTKLNGSDHRSTLSVVMLTGTDSDDTITRINRLGIDDYLVKPVKKIRLLQSLERVTNRVKAFEYQIEAPRSIDNYRLNEGLNAHLFGSIEVGDGGDFFMPIPNQQNGFILGDMMGHGIQARKESFAIKGFVRGFLASKPNCNELLNTLNQALYEEQLCKNSLVTLLAGYVSNGHFYWLNAGHPPPIVIKSNGTLSELAGVDPLLGLSSEHQYEVYSVSLKDVLHILVYTDGLFDNRETDESELLQLKQILPNLSLSQSEFASTLWHNSQVSLTKEIDDASLIVIN